MDSFNLSSKEFLLLCAGLGAGEVYGVEDVYKEMDALNISDEILTVQQSLEKKGYIESDFDGNSSLSADLIEIIKICVACDKFIAADCQLQMDKTVNSAFYIMQDKAVKSEKSNGEYHLKKTDIGSIASDIKLMIAAQLAECESDCKKVRIPQKVLTEIKRLVDDNDDANAKLQLEKYFDKSVADIILSALDKRSSFYSVAVADFKTKDVKNIMLINSEMGIIRIQPVIDGLNSEVEFESIYAAAVNDLLDEYLSAVTGGKSEGNNNG